MFFVIVQKNKLWSWRLLTSEKVVVAQSGRTFATERGALRAFNRFRNLPFKEIETWTKK